MSRRTTLTGAAARDPVRTQRPWVAFCARCGLPPAGAGGGAGAGAGLPHTFSRVCGRCGMGLVLRAPDDVAPTKGEPFLVADRRLAVCALSAGAEDVIGITEPFAIGRLVTELLADTAGPEPVVALVRRAVLDGGPPRRTLAVCAAGGSDEVTVRVGPCGPPRAALVVLEA